MVINMAGADSQKMGRDALLRQRFAYPCLGPVHTIIRPRGQGGNPRTHCLDLLHLFMEMPEAERVNKSALIFLVDGGSDVSPSAVSNLFYLGLLWLKTKVRWLVQTIVQWMWYLIVHVGHSAVFHVLCEEEVQIQSCGTELE